MTPDETLRAEYEAARLLWIDCVRSEDRRGEAFAMRKMDAALDEWLKLRNPQ